MRIVNNQNTMRSLSVTRISLLGNKLRFLRKQKGLTLSELARLSGIEKSTLSRLEAGITSAAHASTLEALARVYEIDSKELTSPEFRIVDPPQSKMGASLSDCVNMINLLLNMEQEKEVDEEVALRIAYLETLKSNLQAAIEYDASSRK